MSAEPALKLPLRSRLRRAMSRGTQGMFRLMLGPVLSSMGRVIRDELRGALWQDLTKTLRATDSLVLSLLRSGTNEGRFQAVAAGPDRILAAHPLLGFMYLDPVDRTVTPRVVAGNYQPGVRIALERLVRPGDVVVEVGSRQGYHTLTCARLASSGGRVVIFEPNERSLAVLRDNIQSHDFQQVISVAASETLAESVRGARLVNIAASMLTPAVIAELSAFPDVRLIVEITPETPPELLAQLIGPNRTVWHIGEDGSLVQTPRTDLKPAPGTRAEYLITREVD